MLGVSVARTVFVDAALNPFKTYLWFRLNAAHADVGAEIPSHFTMNLLSFRAESFAFPCVCFVCFMAQQPLVDQDLIHEVSRSHTTTNHSR